MKTFDTDAHFNQALIKFGYTHVEDSYDLTESQDLTISYLIETMVNGSTKPTCEQIRDANILAKIFLRKKINADSFNKIFTELTGNKRGLINKISNIKSDIVALEKEYNSISKYSESEALKQREECIRVHRTDVSEKITIQRNLNSEIRRLNIEIKDKKSDIKNKKDEILEYNAILKSSDEDLIRLKDLANTKGLLSIANSTMVPEKLKPFSLKKIETIYSFLRSFKDILDLRKEMSMLLPSEMKLYRNCVSSFTILQKQNGSIKHKLVNKRLRSLK